MGTDAGLELPQEIANQPLKAPSLILLYLICVIHGCPYGLTGSASRLGTTHHVSITLSNIGLCINSHIFRSKCSPLRDLPFFFYIMIISLPTHWIEPYSCAYTMNSENVLSISCYFSLSLLMHHRVLGSMCPHALHCFASSLLSFLYMP